jgi:excisionase family DNA binding protein
LVEEGWLTAQEIASKMHVSIRTVHRWLRSGELHGINVSGRTGWRVRPSELERFIKELEGKEVAGA